MKKTLLATCASIGLSALAINGCKSGIERNQDRLDPKNTAAMVERMRARIGYVRDPKTNECATFDRQTEEFLWRVPCANLDQKANDKPAE